MAKRKDTPLILAKREMMREDTIETGLRAAWDAGIYTIHICQRNSKSTHLVSLALKAFRKRALSRPTDHPTNAISCFCNCAVTADGTRFVLLKDETKLLAAYKVWGQHGLTWVEDLEGFEGMDPKPYIYLD